MAIDKTQVGQKKAALIKARDAKYVNLLAMLEMVSDRLDEICPDVEEAKRRIEEAINVLHGASAQQLEGDDLVAAFMDSLSNDEQRSLVNLILTGHLTGAWVRSANTALQQRQEQADEEVISPSSQFLTQLEEHAKNAKKEAEDAQKAYDEVNNRKVGMTGNKSKKEEELKAAKERLDVANTCANEAAELLNAAQELKTQQPATAAPQTAEPLQLT